MLLSWSYFLKCTLNEHPVLKYLPQSSPVWKWLLICRSNVKQCKLQSLVQAITFESRKVNDHLPMLLWACCYLGHPLMHVVTRPGGGSMNLPASIMLGVCLYRSLFQLRMVNIANKAMLTRFMLISFLFQVSLLLLETKMHFNESNNNSQTQPNIHKENKTRIAVTFHYQSF